MRARTTQASGSNYADRPLTRSEIMARIKGRDTKPEMLVRRMLHAMGYRYRVQARGLPGRPDLAFSRRRRAVFVHGCFWHGHDCPRGVRVPKTNADFWRAKIARNRARDAEVAAKLAANGWNSLTVWECGLRDADAVAAELRAFLGPPRADGVPCHRPVIAASPFRRRTATRP